MSSSSSSEQRRQERKMRLKFRKNDLPPAEKPQMGGTAVLRGHDSTVEHVVAIPESGLIATASRSAPGLRIFALDGDGEPLHVCSDAKGNPQRALAALGGDVLAYGDNEGGISTWCASSGARLEVMQLGDQDYAMAMAPSGLGKFVVGTYSGALVFFSHRDGRDLHEVAREKKSHSSWINDIAVDGDAIVTASRDKTAAVWSAATRERLAVLRGHSESVRCAAVCARFIATGSDDETVRLYEAGAGLALVRVIEGLHSNWVHHVGFVGEDMLMSASWGRTVAFTSLSSDTPVARLDSGFLILSASITPDARIACAGYGSDAAIFFPPALVATEVGNHAATVFPSRQSLTFAKNEPIQAALVADLEGSRGAGAACRALVRKNEESAALEEAHRHARPVQEDAKWKEDGDRLRESKATTEAPSREREYPLTKNTLFPVIYFAEHENYSEQMFPLRRMYLSIISDLRLLDVKPGSDAPSSILDFQRPDICLSLDRMPDVLPVDISQPLRLEEFISPRIRADVVSPGPAVRLVDGKRAVFLVTSGEYERNALLCALRLRIAPWSLLLKRMETEMRTVRPSFAAVAPLDDSARDAVTGAPSDGADPSVADLEKKLGRIARRVRVKAGEVDGFLAATFGNGMSSVPDESDWPLKRLGGFERVARTFGDLTVFRSASSLAALAARAVYLIESMAMKSEVLLGSDDLSSALTDLREASLYLLEWLIFALESSPRKGDGLGGRAVSILREAWVEASELVQYLLNFWDSMLDLWKPDRIDSIAAIVCKVEMVNEKMFGLLLLGRAALICQQVVGDEFPFLLDELESVCSWSEARSASGVLVWPFQRLFEKRGVSLLRLDSASKGEEAIAEPDWLKVEQVDYGFCVQSNHGVDIFLIFQFGPLTECGLKLFLSLVLPCEKSLAMLRNIESNHTNCLLEALKVPFPPDSTHVELSVNSGWLEYVSNQRCFVEEHFLRCDGALLVVGPEVNRIRNNVSTTRRHLRAVRADDIRANLNEAISNAPDEVNNGCDHIAESSRMCDGSYFWVPQCTPTQDMPSDFPKLVCPPKKQIVVVRAQEKRLVGGGFRKFVAASVQNERAIDWEQQDIFSQQELLKQLHTFPIVNLAQLNYVNPSRHFPRAPELDERVRFFSKTLSQNGGFNVNPEDVSSCWYHAITSPLGPNHLSYFGFEEGKHTIKVEELNYIDYSISRVDVAKTYAEGDGRNDAAALLRKARPDDVYVIFVHCGSSTDVSKTTRLALFLGQNVKGGVRCNLVSQASELATCNGRRDIPEFRPPPCHAVGEIGGSNPLVVPTACL